MILVAMVVLGFAALVTAHIAIAWGLLWRAPRYRALVALVVPPLAPYWAWREHMRVRAGIWAGALVLYVIARLIAAV